MNLSQYFIKEYKQYLNAHKQQAGQELIINYLPTDYTAIWEDFSEVKTSVSIFPHTINQYVKNHYHNFFEFLYVYKGSCKICVDDSEILLNEKDVCLLNLQAKHSVEKIDPSQNIVYYILVNPVYFRSTYFQLIYVPSNHHVFDFFLESISNHKMMNNYILFSNNQNTSIETLANQVIEESYHDKLYKSEMQNFFLSAFLIELSRKYQDYIYTISRKETGDYTIGEIIDYINSNYRTVTLKNVAKHFNYSTSYLSVLIKKIFRNQFYRNSSYLPLAKVLSITYRN